jgi:hypothetical protein
MKILLDTNDVKQILLTEAFNRGYIQSIEEAKITINKLRAADEITIEIEPGEEHHKPVPPNDPDVGVDSISPTAPETVIKGSNEEVEADTAKTTDPVEATTSDTSEEVDNDDVVTNPFASV